MNKRTRVANVQFRALEDGSRKVEGIACVFDEETDIGGFFYEKIDRHAFDNCDMSDVYCLFNHDENFPLARTLNGSLELGVENIGLRQVANLIDTSQGNDVFKMVRENLIDKMSFAFTIDRENGEEWYVDDEGKEHRTIKKIDKLYDVSIVTYPAYSSTSAFARSVGDLDELAQEHLKGKEERTMEEVKEEVTEVVEEVREDEHQEVVEEVKEETTEPTTEETEEVVEDEKEETTEETIEESTEEVEEEKVEEEKGEERSMNTEFNKVEKREDSRIESTERYVKAYREACMGNDVELRTLTSGMDNAPIPTYMQSKIETAWEKANTIVDLTTQSNIRGILAVPYEADADDAVIHDENTEAPTEEQLSLGQTLLQPVAVKKWIEYTDILEAMTDEQFMDYLVDEVVYRVFKKLNDSIVVGGTDTSGKGVVGIVDASLTLKKSIALGFNSFNEADAELVDGVTSVVIMNKKTFMKNVLGLTDTTGRPIFTQMADVNGKVTNYAGGRLVVFNNKLKDYDTAGAGDVWAIVGDVSAYKLNLPFGKDVKVIKDEITKAREDKTLLTGKIIASGNVTRLDSLIALKKPA